MAVGRPWRWRWFGHALATVVVLTAGALPAASDAGPGRPALEWTPADAAIDIVAAIVLLGRRRWPRTVLAVMLGLTGLSMALGRESHGVVVATAIAIYTCVQHLSRRDGVVVGVAVALLALGRSVVLGEWSLHPVLVVLLGAALGEAVRAQREQLVEARDRARRAEETREALARQRVAETRLSIARDLHDVVAHQIAVINLHAGAASAAVRTRPDDAEAALGTIRQSSRAVLSEIGDLMATLRDPDASTTGPVGLVQLDDVVRQFAVHGLDVTVRVEGDPAELSPAVDTTALRVVQEALTNAHKHGGGLGAHLLVEHLPGRLHLTVTNRYDPHAQARPADGTGHGIVGMAERVEAVRGTMTSGESGPGVWTVAVELPAEPVSTEQRQEEDGR
ncbi:histidine kinase [Xylanimonas cellulosilytica DSM 15894]|uniref:histidine kinase n=1 Tax=Xylanimonas cellulosilytica (strain DSM 15894 / JCM 12276 / CECT 5975 / KCTC 9989 / LMG 20990 / NBRC 107835 / XIL07) TaxID=446471 RepID=D1BSE9_XYLCX|nr:histidine kinase [Xylanimonas cellulosilytica DSM 15894]